MGLFRRKAGVEPEPARCPMCTERVPEGARECAMCGADLRTLHAGSRRATDRQPESAR
jgi:hypothetical protein